MRDLILVGGGHSHVQVLRQAAMEPVADHRLTLVLDRPVAVYSGMVPGFVAGQYEASELEIDCVPLARRAGARVVLSAATRIDAANRSIEVEGRAPLRYDLASLDVGSTVRGLEIEGVRDFALPTRPIGGFVRAVDRRIAELLEDSRGSAARIVVVGAGVGGVELAFSLHHRLLRESVDAVEVVLVHGGAEILPGSPSPLIRRIRRHAEERGFEIRCGLAVTRVDSRCLTTEDGSRIDYDLLVWVTGAAPSKLLADSDLPTDDLGFIRVRNTLQVEGYDDLFAVGDCASLVEHPWVPKAGVYAVRQGPVLTNNLRAAATSKALESYRPQRDFLSLLNLGDGTACGSKWGRSFEGRWVFRLKDRIDRAFMERFRVLKDDGTSTDAFPDMEMPAMVCGGCAAKIGQSALEGALARLPAAKVEASVVLGLEIPDDAVAWRSEAEAVHVSTVDVFSAPTDDPWLVGRVAAINAVSDLLATKVVPRVAQAIVAIPENQVGGEAEETLFQVLHGVRSYLDSIGVALLGGHTTTAEKLMAGLVVEGDTPSVESLWRLSGLSEGQSLILTRALGTGVLLHADAHARCPGRWLRQTLSSLQRSSWEAFKVLEGEAVSAATDVTGFGLAGHAAEMARRSRCCIELDLDSLPVLPGALELLSRGERSTFHPTNESLRGVAWKPGVSQNDPRAALLFDPQTAGGMLVGLAADSAERVVRRLQEAGEHSASIVGRVLAARDDGAVLAVGS